MKVVLMQRIGNTDQEDTVEGNEYLLILRREE